VKKNNIAKRKRQAAKKLTVGIDLGDRSSRYCILDEEGDVISEGSFATTKAGVGRMFESMPRCRIAIETGCHSPWVGRQLTQLGHEVIVANARNVQLISQSTRKDDRLDARTLARLVRIDASLLCPVRHRGAEAQAHLAIIRARDVLVRTRTLLVNAARGLTKSFGERLRKCGTEQVGVNLAAELDPAIRAVVGPLLAEGETLNHRIAEYGSQIEKIAEEPLSGGGSLEKDQRRRNADRTHVRTHRMILIDSAEAGMSAVTWDYVLDAATRATVNRRCTSLQSNSTKA
jgi:transposase